MGCCNFTLKRQKWKDNDLVVEWFPFFRNIKRVRMLMISLDACGKTTLLYQAKLGINFPTIPSIGFNVEVINFDGIEMTIWDVGGGDKIRQLWRHYFSELTAIMYLIDLTDQDRLQLALDELKGVFENRQTQDTFIFVVGNKKQKATVDPNQILQQIQSWRMKQRYRVMVVCALDKQDTLGLFRQIKQILLS